tara:strand:+ start:236 stop:622 length:387 start_codon:yes stop_codon:yes gene_type:complete
MKLIKYIINLFILICSIVFLKDLSEINPSPYEDGGELMINVPEILGFEPLPLWIVVLAVLTIGVLLGFFIALFQILSQKTELMSTRSKLKKLQIEIDNLRNESIEEGIDLSDVQDIELSDSNEDFDNK